ncbi:efflux RND transporter periplasmic adaptor subunit [Pontibacillus marinus]|nr:efflux RND transporter periplasmic adaptor subunit [Pontibacillus marinus]
MKKKTKLWLTSLLILSFAIVNLFLVWLDETNIQQKSYIQKWEQTFEEDLYNELLAEGTLRATTENHVYFDEKLGSFQRFLVKEGQSVESGTPIYEYAVRDYQKSIAETETEIAKIEGELLALEDYLMSVEFIDVPEPDPEEENQRPFAEAEVAKQQRIAKVESQIAQKEAQLTALEDRLSDLESRDQVVQVASPYEGTVTNLSQSLQEPVVTLKQSDLVIRGLVDEGVHQQITTDMKARGELLNQEYAWKGTVDTIGTYPEKEEDEVSYYPYEIQVEDLKEDLNPGYHTTVSFITNEAQNAITAEIGWIQERIEEVEPAKEKDNPTDESDTEDQTTDQVDPLPFKKQRFVWAMTDKGETVIQPIELGMTMGDLVQVTDGLALGQWVADEKESQFREGSLFLTPINLDHLSLLQTKESNGKTIWNYMKMGMLVR